MSFLNSPIEQNLLSQRSRQRRKKFALSLLDRFGEAFPEINYELWSLRQSMPRHGGSVRLDTFGSMAVWLAIQKEQAQAWL